MRLDQESGGGSVVGDARFHCGEVIFDKVRGADAVFCGDFVESVEQIDGAEFRTVDGNGCARCESDFDFLGFVRSIFRRDDPLPHRFVWRVGGIFELAAFVAEVPDVAIAAVDIFLALLDGNVVFLRVGNGIFAGIDVPFAPRSDDLHVWRDRFVGQFKSHLIVALAGAAVRQAVGAELQRNFRLALGDDGTRHGSAEEIGVFVDGAGAESRPNVIAHKFLAKILDVRGRSAGGKRFLARGFQVFLLADVTDYGDDFATVVFLEPRNDDGGIQPAGIGEYDFLRFVQLLIHDSSLAFKCCQAGAQRCCAPTKKSPNDPTKKNPNDSTKKRPNDATKKSPSGATKKVLCDAITCIAGSE